MSTPDRAAYIPQAYQAQPYKRPPEVWTLTLNRYERDNLLQLLQAVMDGDRRPAVAFNNGDWVGEVRWMLGKQYGSDVGPGVATVFSIDEMDNPNPVARAASHDDRRDG